ncbi:MAG: pyridoxamine 5'-phosphate oxidase family protein [Myxococcota bacterium]
MLEPLQLEGLATDVWGWLARGRADRRSPFRTPVVATVDEAGLPSARTVVLRAVDPAARVLEFHTDTRSPKAADVARFKAVTWLFYDPKRQLQVRAVTAASTHTTDAVADAAWAACALPSRAPYMVPRVPGSTLPAGQQPDAFAPPRVQSAEHSEVGRSHFLVVRCRVATFDVLQLHVDGHRRARVELGDAVSTTWLVP